MPPAFLSRTPDLVRLPIVVNVRAVSLSEGMRAGLSVAVVIALNEYLEFPALREAALAALLTCICDPGGPSRRRCSDCRRERLISRLGPSDRPPMR
jgi:hypothetical protein